MYTVSLFFDEQTNHYFNQLIHKIEQKINVSYSIPVHLTLAASYKEIQVNPISSFEIEFVSICLLKGTICVIPVFDDLLYNVYKEIHSCCEEKNCHVFYQKGKYFPHVTLAKHLNAKQMRMAYQTIQNEFVPFKAKVIKMAISQTKPYQTIQEWNVER
ncbi:hypothetical protein [Floccifex sp.]|uniref:hypothetical protein n=1 Tax=Floccifex sp. TaxID=2815810 RepID=UPI003EFC5EE9